MFYRGEILVPPNCPAVLGEWRRGNIGAAVMRFSAHDCESDGAGNLTTTEAFVSFRDDGAEEPFLEPRSLTVPIDSDVSNKARDLADEIEAGDSARLEHMRAALCDRVSKCRGVVDGECWALGPSALSEVITSV